MTAYETIPYKGLTIELHPDHDPVDPREHDNLGRMVCYHPRYQLGDEQPTRDEAGERFHELLSARGRARSDSLGGVALPLYLLDHSGLAMRTGTFAEDPGAWDTSYVGVVYATPEAIRENYMVKRITRKTLALARECLEAEVKEYSDYLGGNVWGYVIKDERGETLDSCWGFIGDSDYCIGEAKSSADFYARDRDREALAIKQRVFTFAGVRA